MTALFFSFSDDFYMREDATSIVNLISLFKTIKELGFLLYFSNKIIVLEIIQTSQGRKAYTIGFAVEAFLIMMKAFLLSDYVHFDSVALSLIVAFAVLSFFLTNMAFLVCLYNLNTLNKQMIRMEVEENKKYKIMFNSIQDAIFLIRDSSIKFMNSLAGSLFRDTEIGEALESEIDIPYFFYFS